VEERGRLDMSKLEDAEATLADFERTLTEGHPWLPGAHFVRCPDLGSHILSALHEFVRVQRVAEQVKPAKRVSLSDNPNWRPSSVAPVLPGSKEWVEPGA
jgi:hypothetical protein